MAEARTVGVAALTADLNMRAEIASHRQASQGNEMSENEVAFLENSFAR